MEVKFVGPPLPPNFRRGQFSDPSLGGVSGPDLNHNYHKKGQSLKSTPITSLLNMCLPLQRNHTSTLRSSTSEHPVRSKGESHKAHKSMTFGDLLTEPKSQLNTDPTFPREVDVSDLPSQYTEDIEIFRQVLNIPDPMDSMPVSSATVLGLNKVAQQQELRQNGPSAIPQLVLP